MALFGAMRFTEMVFAEDEAGIPAEGWTSLSVDRGFAPTDNVATVIPLVGAENAGIMSGTATEALPALQGYLMRIAGYMSAPNMNGFKTSTSPDATGGLLLLPRTWPPQANSLGWNKAKVKQFLWDNAFLTVDQLKANILSTSGLTAGQVKHVCANPSQITLVIAGGAQSAHSLWCGTALTQTMQSVKIALPAAWDKLIAQAEKDLGPLPPAPS